MSLSLRYRIIETHFFLVSSSMAAPVEPAAEALAALAAQPIQPSKPAEAAAPPAAPAAAEVPVEVLNPPQAARNNDEVLIILSLA